MTVSQNLQRLKKIKPLCALFCCSSVLHDLFADGFELDKDMVGISSAMGSK